MNQNNYHSSILSQVSADEAFKSINSVSDWWTENMEGRSEKLNDIFTVRFGETYITIKIIELVPGKKISWQVIDCNKHWLKNKKEWKDTQIDWEISTKKDGTQINFTHLGLIPKLECFGACSDAWSQYLQESLFSLLATGKGHPDPKAGKTKAAKK